MTFLPAIVTFNFGEVTVVFIASVINVVCAFAFAVILKISGSVVVDVEE